MYYFLLINLISVKIVQSDIFTNYLVHITLYLLHLIYLLYLSILLLFYYIHVLYILIQVHVYYIFYQFETH